MMVAQAGTSHTGSVYRYYACVRQKKHKCDKKMLSKDKLEDFIVYKTMEMLKEDSAIEELAVLLIICNITKALSCRSWKHNSAKKSVR